MVEDVAFSPDGKTLAMASYEGNVQLWDVATGKLLETLKGHSSAVQAVVFSPDGRTLASGSTDQTVRLWNVETRRELMQLDPGSVELGAVYTLAFSPDGKQLLAGGQGGTAFWSAAPIVWNDPDRAAETLRRSAAFERRLPEPHPDAVREPPAARSAGKARRERCACASRPGRHAGQLACLAPGVAGGRPRLRSVGGRRSNRTRRPGCARLGCFAWRRPWCIRIGLPTRPCCCGEARNAARRMGFRPLTRSEPASRTRSHDGAVRVTELLPGYPGSRAGLVPGDTLVKVNDTELTRESTPRLGELLAGEAGTKVRLLRCDTPGAKNREVIELTRERFVNDPATGELLQPLLRTVTERLAKDPRNVGLLELHAELAGQESDWMAQAADYTAVIEDPRGTTGRGGVRASAATLSPPRRRVREPAKMAGSR